MNSLDVVPSFLQQGRQEVESRHSVLSDFLISHGYVSNSNVQVGNFLELPLDGGLHISDLLLEGLGVRNWLRELLDSVKDWTDNGWHFLDEVVSGQKKIELLSPLLNELFVLVELLQVIKGSDFDTRALCGESSGSSLILMLLIQDQAELELFTRNVWQSD